MSNANDLPEAATDLESEAPTPVVLADVAVGAREILALAGTVILADLALYHGGGYSGWAAVIGCVPLLLLLGSPLQKRGPAAALVAALLLLVAARLAWCGGPLAVAAGLALLPVFTLALQGRVPDLIDSLSVAVRVLPAGWLGAAEWGRDALREGRRFVPANWIATALPILVGSLFAIVFLMANPDLVTRFNQSLAEWLDTLGRWIVGYSAWEALFWLTVAWLMLGLLRPLLPPLRLASAAPVNVEAVPAPLYAAFRNTLLTVIVLFGVYLTFEFATLWFREFPAGFHYSGYAHEGAAWLTIALGLATAVLSLIFRGRLLSDPRLGLLKRLAAIWSAENLILAVAVYYRLSIYVGFNGLTRMRFVGYFGVTAVVIGFVLVVIKILRQHNFGRLLRRQLWTLGLTAYVFAITPIDWLAMRYNVQRVLAGNLRPSVQFTVQPLTSEALLTLPPLLNSTDPIIRDGIRSLLFRRQQDLEAQQHRQNPRDWTGWQGADRVLLQTIAALPKGTFPYDGTRPGDGDWQTFVRYAYQWY